MGAGGGELVLPGDPSDPRARSPLTAPGVAVTIGDIVLAVDGHPVDLAERDQPSISTTPPVSPSP